MNVVYFRRVPTGVSDSWVIAKSAIDDSIWIVKRAGTKPHLENYIDDRLPTVSAALFRLKQVWTDFGVKEEE